MVASEKSEEISQEGIQSLKKEHEEDFVNNTVVSTAR